MKSALVDGLWAHIGALVAVGLGFSDLVHFHALGTNADELLIVGGLAVFGVNVTNTTIAK